MEITLLTQPHGEPRLRLGEQIRDLLSGREHRFSLFAVVAAFVKQSGVSRIASELRAFRQVGGRAIACAGIDHGGSSKQGIQALRSLFDEVYIFHDRDRTRTFHPKLYLFESDTKAVVFVGSGNLTKGGLFTNYEVQVRLDFDRSNQADERIFQQLRDLFQYYRDTGNPQVKSLRPEIAAALEQGLPDEFVDAVADADASEGPERGPSATTRENEARIEGFFGSMRFPGAPAPDPSMRPPRIRRTRRPRPTPLPTRPPAAPSDGLGAGFWKILSRWDANPGSAPGQIQIPIQFKPFFPPLRDSRDPTQPRPGNFQDTAPFSVRFRDGDFSLTVNDARYIVYPPGARPNAEGRFNFRERRIFARFTAGDMLIFRRSGNRRIVFEVERVASADPRYRRIRGAGARRWGLIEEAD